MSTVYSISLFCESSFFAFCLEFYTRDNSAISKLFFYLKLNMIPQVDSAWPSFCGIGAAYTSESWDVNRHTARCTSPVSVVSQCKNWCLAEGLRKRRSAPLYMERTLRFRFCVDGICYNLGNTLPILDCCFCNGLCMDEKCSYVGNASKGLKLGCDSSSSSCSSVAAA